MAGSPTEIESTASLRERERRTGRLASQRASSLRRLALVWLLGVAGLSVVALQERVPVEELLLDASVVGGGRWYAGLVTSLTVMGWTVSAVALGFAALASRVSGRQGAAHATGWMALILVVLLFDDLFLLHTSVIPALIGGSKWVFVLAEALAVLVWVARWRSEIVRTRWELLVAASVGFGFSLGFDRFPFGGDRWALIAEDGAKVLGVVAIATWAVSTATDLIVSIAGSSGRRSGASSGQTPQNRSDDAAPASPHPTGAATDGN